MEESFRKLEISMINVDSGIKNKVFHEMDEGEVKILFPI